MSHLTHMGQYQSVINPNGGKNTDTFVTIDNQENIGDSHYRYTDSRPRPAYITENRRSQ